MESTDQAGRKREHHAGGRLEEEQSPGSGRTTASTNHVNFSGSGIMTMVTDQLTGAMGSLIFKLGKLVEKEYKLQKELSDKIESLKKELECAQTALWEVAGVPTDQLDEEFRIWAREVREASYDMEDVLDTYNVHVDSSSGSHEHSDHEGLFKRLAGGLFGRIGNLFKRRKISTATDDIYKRLDNIAQRYRRNKVESTIVARPNTRMTIDPRLDAMYKQGTQLVGIDKPSSDLISMLSLSPQGDNDESKKKIKMVSIVGAGGLGKTTLAKAVYDKLKVNFDCTAFVPVGRKPDLNKVFIDILIDLDNKKYMDPKFRLLDARQLINVMREHLTDKRYFIVIDDVWEMETWESIKFAMYENNNGSRLITTTRIWNVAAQSGQVYKLEPLPHDQSKKLFYTRIFGANGTCPNNQLEVSDKILNKCGGVPLAIMTMASLLVDKTHEEWTEVCESVVFRDRKKNRQVSDTEWILSLSYYDMPPHLQACLLYISAFPEDNFIPKDPLIRMWMAEGFVHNEQGTRSFEVGESYFNELINRSMIRAAEEEEEGDDIVVYGCRIHDMVLDLLRVKSQEENFFTVVSSSTVEGTSPCRVRRLSYQKRIVEQSHQDTTHVRTFLAFWHYIIDETERFSFQSFNLLRVLELEIRNNSLQLDVQNLHHLRYLGLRHFLGGTVLLEGIGVLKFLQTLDLADCTIEELPSSVGLLTQLICLRVGSRVKVPNGIIEKLTSLEELKIYVRVDTMSQFIKELDNLHELRVLDAYVGTKPTTTMESDLVETLGKLHKLQHLTLKNSSFTNEAIWEAVVFQRPLQYLIVPFTTFLALPSCINPSDLPNLTRLELIVHNMDEQSLRNLGGLPELRHLKLEIRSSSPITIQTVDGFFQKLVSLSLPYSSVHFGLNEDLTVTFTVWYSYGDGVAFGSENRDKQCMVQASAVMPNLQQLDFWVHGWALVDSNVSCDRLGLEHLPSLQEVEVKFWCDDDFWSYDDIDEPEAALKHAMGKQEAALKHAMEAHPNRPTIDISTIDIFLCPY